MAVEKGSSAVLRSVRVAATCEKVGLTPRYSRALHLNLFEQSEKQIRFHYYTVVDYVFADFCFVSFPKM